MALGLGLPASFVEDVDLPFAVAGAVRFEEQAEFHPVKYLEGLAARARREGLRGHDGHERPWRPCAHGRRPGRKRRACGGGHAPSVPRSRALLRSLPSRALVRRGRPHRQPRPRACTSPPSSPRTRSGRMATGCSWEARATRPARPTPRSATRAWRRGRASASGSSPSCAGRPRTTCRWTACPSLGATTRSRRASGWPPASASGASRWARPRRSCWPRRSPVRDHAWTELFDPQRVRPRASATSFVKENANVALRFLGDRVAKRGDVDEIGPGEGRVVGPGLGQRAVYRDEDGTLHELSARCTHLGCIVNWNTASAPGTAPATGRALPPAAR